ncbi:hypothetical protein [uncultured Sphingomonas sp.]|uniref:hypothetical protein n=1 Tax=uncultured Sphingomonas sp. TaxID=158754 RepID=UPI00374A3468
MFARPSSEAVAMPGAQMPRASSIPAATSAPLPVKATPFTNTLMARRLVMSVPARSPSNDPVAVTARACPA